MDEFLGPLEDVRPQAVKAWMAEALGDCPVCDKPVLVMHGHRRIKTGLAHRACADSVEPAAPPARPPGLTPRAS